MRLVPKKYGMGNRTYYSYKYIKLRNATVLREGICFTYDGNIYIPQYDTLLENPELMFYEIPTSAIYIKDMKRVTRERYFKEISNIYNKVRNQIKKRQQLIEEFASHNDAINDVIRRSITIHQKEVDSFMEEIKNPKPGTFRSLQQGIVDLVDPYQKLQRVMGPNTLFNKIQEIYKTL